MYSVDVYSLQIIIVITAFSKEAYKHTIDKRVSQLLVGSRHGTFLQAEMCLEDTVHFPSQAI